MLRAAAEVIAQHELTLERVAAAAGVSRVTLYRRGVTEDLLVDAFAVGAVEAWQAAIWPAPTGAGTAAERLQDALSAGCDVVEAHLPLLAGLGTAPYPVFRLEQTTTDLPTTTRDVHVAPLERLLRDGAVDGTLASQEDPYEAATTLFNVLP